MRFSIFFLKKKIICFYSEKETVRFTRRQRPSQTGPYTEKYRRLRTIGSRSSGLPQGTAHKLVTQCFKTHIQATLYLLSSLYLEIYVYIDTYIDIYTHMKMHIQVT